MAKIYDAEMQYLNVAYAKDVGLNKLGGVEAFESDCITREAAGLKPLLVYSVVAPCYSVWARLLVNAAAPIPISQFLSRAWSAQYDLSMPHRLETESALLGGDHGFVDWARLQGVACSPASSPKALRSFARLAHDLQWAIDWPKSTKGTSAPLLESANTSLFQHDTFSVAISSGIRKSMDQLTFESWMRRERRYCSGHWIENDWSSTCLVDRPRPVPKPHLAVSRSSEHGPLYVPGLKEIVAMWPGGRRAFFQGIDVSAADFDHWAAGRAHLPRYSLWAILEKVGCDFDPREGGYALSGGNLLVAHSPNTVQNAYNELSHGGDLEFAFEITPPSGEDIGARVLVFAPWGGQTNLILFPRDDKRGASLDRLDLINRNPPRRASPEVWETLSWISENCERFEKPQTVAMEFGQRHRSWLSANW